MVFWICAVLRRRRIILGLAAVATLTSSPVYAAGPVEVEATPNEPAIYNGTVATDCQWPTTVGIWESSICSAVLIHPEIVMFAAHCNFPEFIRFGESLFSPSPPAVAVEYCLRNPKYEDIGGEDYAYCRLSEPVEDIPPTPVLYGCELDLLDSVELVAMVGFGKPTPDIASGTKRWDTTSVISYVEEPIPELFIGQTGEVPCAGDSGGPAYIQLEDGSWRVIGVVSAGFVPCGEGDELYAPTHVAVEWIEATSGVDVTPCHDADGAWNPSEDCGGFALDPLMPEGGWAQGCEGPRSGWSRTCGPAHGELLEDPEPPTVVITEPVDGTVFEGPLATVDIGVDAFDAETGIKRVYLEINGQPIIDEGSEPYAFEGLQFPEGGYILVAQAEDWGGNRVSSAPVAIGVDQDPPAPPEEPEEGEETESGGEGTGSGGTGSGGTGSGDPGSGDPGVEGEKGCACSAASSSPAQQTLLFLSLLVGLNLLGGGRRRA